MNPEKGSRKDKNKPGWSKMARSYKKKKNRFDSLFEYAMKDTSSAPLYQSPEAYEAEQKQLGLQANAGVEGSYKPFNWQHHKYDEGVEFSATDPVESKKGVASLKELASIQLGKMIVEYPEDLTENMLKQSMLNWDGGWKYVWDEIARAGSDSYSMFQRFANVFGDDRRFRCHGKQTYAEAFGKSRLVGRPRCLSERLQVGKSSHRVEQLPLLQNMKSLVFELNNRQHFKFVTFIDMGIRNLVQHQHERQAFLDIMALPSLVALEVSGCENVDATVLRCWSLAIKSGQWHSLRLLDVNGCKNVSTQNVTELMKTSKHTPSSVSGLVYIRTSVEPYTNELDGLWSTQNDLVFTTKDQPVSFPKSKLTKMSGLVNKFMFLRALATRAQAMGVEPIVVNPEGFSDYVRKQFLFQEFVLHYGEGPGGKTGKSGGFEFFRIAWPDPAEQAGNKRTASEQSNATVKRRQKIKSRGVQFGANGIF